MEKALPNRKPVPKKVMAGRVLLIVSGITFLIAAVGLIGFFVFAMVFFADTQTRLDQYIGSYISLFSLPFLALFYILSLLGAVDFVREKGKFISACGFCAVIMLIVMLVELYLDTRSLIKGVYTWFTWTTSLIFLIGSEGLYFLGWNLAKDDFE